MSAEGEQIVADDGTPLGQRFTADDGSHVLVGFDGQVLAAVDADNQPIDPAQFEIVGAQAEHEDPRAAELSAQLDAMNARLDEQDAQRQPIALPSPNAVDPELQQEAWQHEHDRLQAALGRSLTDRERRELAQRSLTEGHGSLIGAGMSFADDGQSVLRDLDAGSPMTQHEARTAHMAELIEDQAGTHDLATGDPLPQREAYDLADMDQRHQYMADRLSGAASAEQAYDSGDLDAGG